MADRDIFLIEVARRGRDGDYAGASEVAALQSRADALEARPNITSLNAVPNVNAPSPASGQVLRWDGSAWSPVTPSSGVRITRAAVEVEDSASTLDFGSSFNLGNPSNGLAVVTPSFAGSGTSPSFARSDHMHTIVSDPSQTFGPMGYMSSGTRVLATTNVVLADSIGYLVKATLKGQIRGADAGSCYYQLRLTINGNARTSSGGANGFWCVQGVPREMSWSHSMPITGTGAAITISAEVMYHSGGGFNTDAGELDIMLYPRR